MINYLFICCGLLISSCVHTPTPNQSNKAIDQQQHIARQWMLVSMGSFAKDSLIKYRAQVDLSDLKQAQAGFDCNRISLTPKFRNSQGIIFTNIIQTEMGCGPQQQSMEAYFMKIASTIDGYVLDGHRCKFMANGKVAFEAVAADFD